MTVPVREWPRQRTPCFVETADGHVVTAHPHFRGNCMLSGTPGGIWARYRAHHEDEDAKRRARWGYCMLCGQKATHSFWIGNWANVESFAILCCDCRMDRPIDLVGEETCDEGCGIPKAD